MNTGIKPQIETALRAFSGSDLRAAASSLLNSLGYQSEKTLDLDNTPDAFLGEFDKRDRKFRKAKALFERWKSVEFLFKITDDEVRNADEQGTLFDSGYDDGNYQSYLFFALDLKKNHYTRTQLADITREINLLFDMPAMLLIRHNCALTFSIIDRRLHKKDQSRDVLEKVKLIKDIRYEYPHRAHIEILHDLALPTLMAKHECRDFKQLHDAWRTTLDTNELNKKFYRELADWYFWALDHVEYPSDVDKDTATRNATNVIRLLTRLIFCWFLKEKGLIPADLFSERKLADVLNSLNDDDSSFYQAILQNLFFGTLNQRMNTGGLENRRFANDGPFLERKDEYGVKNLYRYQKLFAIAEEEAVKLFSDIPFLNGGLFDCLDKEDDSGKVIYVDGFTRNARKQPKVPNFLFFSDYRTLDLSDAYGDKKRKKEKVRGLINLLVSYNPETGTTARKQTGSFYTPREIVNYMVDESLIAYLEGQLKAKVPKLAEMKDLQDLLREVFAYTEKAHPFDEGEVEALIDAIDNCKILDPACGSGAFPMGILHKLVFILGKIDPNNDRWKEKQIAKAEQIPDVSAREIAVGAIEKDFETNDLNYGRKLYLIENCIYGVDIQPIAIQISKLRFFISLICDQRTNKNKAQNCGVRPLPNLETKFVAANTLISLDRGQDQLLLTDLRLPKLERELATVRHKHFAVQRRRDKLALQRRDAEIRKELAVVLAGSMSGEASHQLAAWDPYDQNISASFFDPEWMFGITKGFYVVIGNPPYGFRKIHSKSEKKYFKRAFRVAQGSYEHHFLFYERTLEMLQDGGTHAFITPMTWLTISSAHALRAFVLGRYALVDICWFGEQVFHTASVNNVISVIRRVPDEHTKVSFFDSADAFPTSPVRSNRIRQAQFVDDDYYIGIFEDSADRQLLKKMKSRSAFFSTYARPCSGYNPYEVGKGIAPGGGVHTKETIRQKPYHSNRKRGKEWKQEIVGRDLDRYRVNVTGERWIMYGPWLAAPRNPENYIGKRLLVQEITGGAEKRIVAAYYEKPLYHSRDIIPVKITVSFPHSHYLLAIVNSRLLSWYHRKRNPKAQKGLFPKVLVSDLRTLPIRDVQVSNKADVAAHDEIVALTKKLMEFKQSFVSEESARKFDEQIDAKIYALYGLTPDEIAIVEGRNT